MPAEAPAMISTRFSDGDEPDVSLDDDGGAGGVCEDGAFRVVGMAAVVWLVSVAGAVTAVDAVGLAAAVVANIVFVADDKPVGAGVAGAVVRGCVVAGAVVRVVTVVAVDVFGRGVPASLEVVALLASDQLASQLTGKKKSSCIPEQSMWTKMLRSSVGRNNLVFISVRLPRAPLVVFCCVCVKTQTIACEV